MVLLDDCLRGGVKTIILERVQDVGLDQVSLRNKVMWCLTLVVHLVVLDGHCVRIVSVGILENAVS